MKKFAVLIALLLVPTFAFAFGSAPKPPVSGSTSGGASSAAYPYLIDNFDDGDFTRAPEWYKFDAITPVVEKAVKYQDGDMAVVAKLGGNVLHVAGHAANWYAGGMGVYLGMDATKYKSLEMDVYGNGEGSGQMKIELYDNDSGSYDIEVDKNWVPTKDDLWVYELNVNWKGWKHVSIPFASFSLSNPGRGNGVWGPAQVNGSGGLIKMQLIYLGNKQVSDINLCLANIMLGN